MTKPLGLPVHPAISAISMCIRSVDMRTQKMWFVTQFVYNKVSGQIGRRISGFELFIRNSARGMPATRYQIKRHN